MALTRYQKRIRIRQRIRNKVNGTADQPRLSVFRSNKEIYAQLVNDETRVTIVSASSLAKGINKEGTKSDVAKEVGKALAEKAKESGVETCSFDRGGYRYHGRIKALADGAREGGLKF